MYSNSNPLCWVQQVSRITDSGNHDVYRDPIFETGHFINIHARFAKRGIPTYSSCMYIRISRLIHGAGNFPIGKMFPRPQLYLPMSHRVCMRASLTALLWRGDESYTGIGQLVRHGGYPCCSSR